MTTAAGRRCYPFASVVAIRHHRLEAFTHPPHRRALGEVGFARFLRPRAPASHLLDRPARQVDMVISGAECVEALRLAGFRLVERGESATILRRGGRVVNVPNAPVLTEQVLAGVLTAAGMSELGFHTLLSDAPTLNQMKTLADRDD